MYLAVSLYSEYTRNLYGNQHDYKSCKSDKYKGKITEGINLLRKKKSRKRVEPSGIIKEYP